MDVIRVAGTCALFVGMSLWGTAARGMDCTGLPTSFTGNEFPNGDFFTNFNNPCYTIRLGTGNGNIEYGDRNAIYYQMFYKVDPRFQLILVGDFPNTRYFSVSLNDAHSALSQSILDTNIVPLTSQSINPYLPGVTFMDGQKYAVPINFGGTPGSLETGCMMSAYNVDVNALDATQRHPGMDWNSDAAFFQTHATFINHVVDTPQHTNPNTGGVLMMRAYLNDTVASYDTNPHIIVRDVASGCAYPAAYALATLGILAANSETGHAWIDQTQGQGHHTYETSYLPKLCNAPPDPLNSLRWSREPDYIPVTNPDAGYVVAPVPAGLPATLAAAGEVMRIRVRIPSTPPTPCTNGCVRTGNEQMRYMSLSFMDGTSTMASIQDGAFTKDPQGYATLIVGTGANIPAWINAANGYTVLDLTALPNYQLLSLLALRHIIPNTGFECAAKYVPYRTSVDTPAGSLLGDYTPVVDYPLASSLPAQASALVGPSACGLFPLGEPGVRPSCGVFPTPSPTITSIVTECSAPGCNQFVAQTNPPITIVGNGFGTFPNGAPFTGNSNYLGMRDVTQGWDAGYTGSKCTVSIANWDTQRIQFVANVNAKGVCVLASGDKLIVEVWNPQTLLSMIQNLTVQ
jgi:hypothetical protein